MICMNFCALSLRETSMAPIEVGGIEFSDTQIITSFPLLSVQCSKSPLLAPNSNPHIMRKCLILEIGIGFNSIEYLSSQQSGAR